MYMKKLENQKNLQLKPSQSLSQSSSQQNNDISRDNNNNNHSRYIDNNSSFYHTNEELPFQDQHRSQQIALNNTTDRYDLDRVNLRHESTLRTEIVNDTSGIGEEVNLNKIDLINNRLKILNSTKGEQSRAQQYYPSNFSEYNQQLSNSQNGKNGLHLQENKVDINMITADQEFYQKIQQQSKKKEDQPLKDSKVFNKQVSQQQQQQKLLQSNGLQSNSIQEDNSNPITIAQDHERRYHNNLKNKQRISLVTLNYFDRIKIMAQIKPKIKKFFENKTIHGKTRTLNNQIRSYINDSSDFHVDRKIGNGFFMQLFTSFIYKLYLFLQLYRLPLFNPESKIKVIFNSIIVTYNCFYLFIISLKVFFQADFGHTGDLFHEIALVAWVIEMAMEMNTAMYHNHIFVTDRKIIMKIYLKEYFFFEILPLIFEGRSSDNIYYNILLHLPLLLKIKGMMINLEKLEFYILQLLNKQHIFQLFKLLMQMLLLGHIVACLWNCVAQIEVNIMQRSYTWVQASHIIDGDWWKTYLYAQYWAFTTMKNIGTTPNTEAELVFTSICMILSCIVFGYLLNAIGNIIQDMAQTEEDYKKDLSILNAFMKRKEISLGLKRRANIGLKKFYEHQSKEKFSQEKEIVNKLNQQLVNEIVVSSSKKVLQNFPFFYELFSESTISKLYNIMEEVILAPSQIVFDSNHYIDDSYSVYLIVKGSVLYYAETLAEHEEENYNLQTLPTLYQEGRSAKESAGQLKQSPVPNRHNHHYKKKVKTLTKGQSFGIVGFFTGRKRVLNVQSNGYSTVIKIERNKFLQILEENKNDYEKFMEIKDKLLFEGDFDDLSLFCYICNSKEHLSNECNKVHLDKKSLHIIFKHNYSSIQSRSQRERKKFRSKQTLHERSNIGKVVDLIREEYSLLEHTDNIGGSFCDSSQEFGCESSPKLPPPRSVSYSNQPDEINSSNIIQQNYIDGQAKSKFGVLDDENNQQQIEQCESELIQTANLPAPTCQARQSIYQHLDSQTENILNRNNNKPLQDTNNKILRPTRVSNFNEREFQGTEKEKESISEDGYEYFESRRHSQIQKDHIMSSQKKITNSPRKKKNSSLIFEDSVLNLNEKKPHHQTQSRDSLNNLIKNLAFSLQEQLGHGVLNSIAVAGGGFTQVTFQNQGNNKNQFSELLSSADNKLDSESKPRLQKKSKHFNNLPNLKNIEQGIQKSNQTISFNNNVQTAPGTTTIYNNGNGNNAIGNGNGYPLGSNFIQQSNLNSFERLKTGLNNINAYNRIGTNQSFRNFVLLQQQQQQLLLTQEQNSFILNMDIMKNYNLYFPNFNCSEVIRRHNTALFRWSKKRRNEKRRNKTQIETKRLKKSQANLTKIEGMLNS